MVDVLPKGLMTLTEAAKCIPGREPGRRVSVMTVHRWAARGNRGVRLRTQFVGGIRMTTPQWVREFVAALNGELAPAPAAAAPNAEERLIALGA